MPSTFGNLHYVGVSSAPRSESTIPLGGAITGFRDFSGIPSGAQVSYALEDGANREVGRAVFSTAGPVLNNRTPLVSTAGVGVAIDASALSRVSITVLAEDISDLYSEMENYARVSSNHEKSIIDADEFMEFPNIGNSLFSTGYRSNWIKNSDGLSTWTKTSIGTIATVVGPGGELPYKDAISYPGTALNASLKYVLTNSTTGYWTFSVWARVASGTATIKLGIDTSAGADTPTAITIDTKWRRIKVTRNLTAAHTTKTCVIIIDAKTVELFGAMLDDSATLRGYYPTTNTEYGGTHYAQFRKGANGQFYGKFQGTTVHAYETLSANRVAIGSTPTDSLVFNNGAVPTAASPVEMTGRIRWEGRAWSTSSNVDMTVNQTLEAMPLTGSAPTGDFRFGISVGGGAYEYVSRLGKGVADVLGCGGSASLNLITQGTGFDANGRAWHIVTRPTNYSNNTEAGDLMFFNWNGAQFRLACTFDFPTLGATFEGPLRINSANDLSLSSTNHSLQIGSSSAPNLSFDDNEIMARNNGAAATLYLNNEGGTVATRDSFYTTTGSGISSFTSGGAGMASTDWNYVFSAANDVGTKLVMFVNGSARSADGGASGATIRNDAGPLTLGGSSQVTKLNGDSIHITPYTHGDVILMYQNRNGAAPYWYFNTGGTYGVYSDARLKEDITHINTGDAVDFILKLNPATFRWKQEYGATYLQPGLIAQDVLDAIDGKGEGFKNILSEKPDPETGEVFYGLNENKLHAPTIAALQYALAEIEMLKAEIAELKASK